nr:uncharacterized protein LOC123745138 [Procambarus clarkii]
MWIYTFKLDIEEEKLDGFGLVFVSLPSGVLRHLHSLAALNLEDNLLQELHYDDFLGLNDTLNSLSLLNNRLTRFPTRALSTLTQLKVLDVGFNMIPEVPVRAFQDLRALTLLALDGNPITTLPEEALAPLASSLRGLSLGGEFLQCDCRVSWVSQWMNKSHLRVTSRGVNPQYCGRPPEYRNLSLHHLSYKDFYCNTTLALPTTSTPVLPITFPPTTPSLSRPLVTTTLPPTTVQPQITLIHPDNEGMGSVDPSVARTGGGDPSVARTGGGDPSVARTGGGDPSVARTGGGDPSVARTGGGDPSVARTGGGDPSVARTGGGDPSVARTGGGDPSVARTGGGDPSVARTGGGDPSVARTGGGDPSVARTGGGDPSVARTGGGDPSVARTGGGDPSVARTGGGDPSVARTGGGDPSVARTGGGDPSVARTGGGDPSVARTGGGDPSVARTGGGDPSVARTGGGDPSVARTGGGDPSVARTGGGDPSVARTGGGDPSVARTGGGDPSVARTGGGDPSVARTGGGDPSVARTGGGDSSVARTGGGDSSVARTGGGDPSVARTPPIFSVPSELLPARSQVRLDRPASQPVPSATLRPPLVLRSSPAPPLVLRSSPAPPLVLRSSPAPPLVLRSSPAPPLVLRSSPAPPLDTFLGGAQAQRPDHHHMLEREVRVQEAYRHDHSVVIRWSTEDSHSQGFRVVYRLFGDTNFKVGPPLSWLEREFKIKNVPAHECLVVCVVTLHHLPLTPYTVTPSQCREIQMTLTSTTHMDTIIIAASAAICGTVILAVTAFICCSRGQGGQQAQQGDPAILSPGSPPLASLGTLGRGTRPDWDSVSMYSQRSIPRARMYHMEKGSVNNGFVSEDARSHISQASLRHPSRSHSVAGGHRSYSALAATSTHAFMPALHLTTQELSMSQGSLGSPQLGAGRLQSLPVSPSQVWLGAPVTSTAARRFTRAKSSRSESRHQRSKSGERSTSRHSHAGSLRHSHAGSSRHSHAGSAHSLTGYDTDGCTDHDMDIYIARNPTRGGLVQL